MLLLLFTFVFCGSSESDSVTESIEPIETTTSTTSTTTTTKAQDSTTTSTTSPQHLVQQPHQQRLHPLVHQQL